MVPTPSAPPKAFFTPDLWEAIPTVNISAPDIFIPPPTPTFDFVLDEEDQEQPFEVPQEEMTTSELLWEIWSLFKLLLLCITTEINAFVMRHPYIRSEKIICRLRRVYWPVPPLSRSRSRDRSLPCSPGHSPPVVQKRAISCSPRLPSAPAPAPASAIAPSSPKLPSSSPSPLLSAFTSPLPLTLSFPASPPPLALSPAASPPPTLSGPPSPPAPVSNTPPVSSQTQSRSSSPSGSIVERLRLHTQRREQRNRILELEREVHDLKSKIEEMQHCGLALAPATELPTQQVPIGQPVFPTGSAPPPLGQPVFHTGSAPPLPPSQHFGLGHCPPPPNHFGFDYRSPPSQHFGFRYPPPSRPSNPPPDYGQAPTDQMSLDAFLKKYPQTGSKRAE